MDLRVTIFLLSVLITGGHSLKCYDCSPDKSGACESKEKTCVTEDKKCLLTTVTNATGSFTMQGCAKECECGQCNASVKMSFRCCDTDLCNGADGVYMDSFLLMCPLFFYFLCY